MVCPIAPGSVSGSHPAPAATTNEILLRRLSASRVTCVGSLLAILIQLSLNASKLFRRDDRLVDIFCSDARLRLMAILPPIADTPNDVSPIDFVFQNASNSLLLHFPRFVRSDYEITEAFEERCDF